MRGLLIFIIILINGLSSFSQDEYLSGLYFSSHEVIQDKRTSLNLTPESPFKFPDGFSLEMEANFRRGDGFYGYIFRLIGNGHTNIDLVSNLASTSSNFSLVLKDKVLCSYEWANIPNGGYDCWIKIRLDVDVRNSMLAISMNGRKTETKIADITGLKDFSMVFGACRYNSFFNTDVSPMSLKNVLIFDQKNRLVFNWKLSKHSQTVVYDEIKHTRAHVDNPNWNIDKHLKWSKLKNFTLDSVRGVAYDDQNGRIFFVDKKAVYVLSVQTRIIDTLHYSVGMPYPTRGNQIIYNQFTNELWSYDFFKGQTCEISKFNFKTRSWSYNEAKSPEPDYWHHNKFFSPIDFSLVTLFGYGFYTYKGSINRYNETTKSWEQTDISQQVPPRYLSAFGLVNQKEALVFGGYGSKTGKQELSPEFYYDLYIQNLKDFSFRKIWTLDAPALPFVPCESLIADEQNGQFYTLLYNRTIFSTYLHLARFKTEIPEYQLYNDSIPYSFLDTKSWSTLLLDKKSSQLIAITTLDNAVELYSIAYPPLMPGDVYQNDPAESRWYLILIGVLLIGVVALATHLLFRKRKIRVTKKGLYEQVEHPSILPVQTIDRKTVSSVLLMGGFQIYSSKGREVTAAFSPTMKHLFLFILLYTLKNEKGISSAKLDEILWFNKMGESARNNRNVNISKLRSALEEVNGLELVNENSYWKVKIDDSIYCDCCEILKLLQKSKLTTPGENEIDRLIGLLSWGEFLPAIQNDWMDGFRSWFANEIIDGLSALFNGNVVTANFSLRYHVAECILVYDPLNDEAFTMKCSILYHLGKKGMAKSLYDSYNKEYKQVLGIEYNVSFNETIK